MNSLFFLLSFFLGVVGYMFIYKEDKRRSILGEFIISIITILCIGTLGALCMSLIHIPVNILSMGILYLGMAVCFAFYIVRTKRKQNFYLEKSEIVAFVILSVVFLLVELKVYGYSLRAAFVNGADYGNHFSMALDVVKNKKVSGMYFAPLFNALIIEVVAPFLEEVKLYKGFILADTLHYYIDILFFYVLLLEGVEKREKRKWILIVITLLYWCGYPLYVYIAGNRVYWGWGVILIAYVALLCKRWVENSEKEVGQLLLISVGCIAVTVCYSLFAPVVILLVMVSIIKCKNIEIRKYLNIKKILVGIGILLLVGIIAVISYVQFFKLYSIAPMLRALLEDGPCYFNLYSNFILFVPVILLYFLKYRKKDVFDCFFIGTVFIMIMMLCMRLAGFISTYYFSKFYWILWLFMWLIIGRTVMIVDLNRKDDCKIYFSYIAMLVIVLLSSFLDIGGYLKTKEPALVQNWQNTGTDIYNKSIYYLKQNYENYEYSTENLEIDEYVLKHLKGKNVAFIGRYGTWVEGLWHKNISGQINLTVPMSECAENEWKEYVESDDYDYFVILKWSELYENYKEYFEKFEIEYENEEGIIFKQN